MGPTPLLIRRDLRRHRALAAAIADRLDAESEAFLDRA